MGEIQIKCIGDAAGFEALKGEWADLIDRDSRATLFQTWGWNHAIYQSLYRHQCDLAIVAFYRDDRLVGLAPLGVFVQKAGPICVKTLAFLGKRFSDYQDLLIDDDYREAVQARFAQWLREASPALCDEVDLGNVPDGGHALGAFQLLKKEAPGASIETCGRAPYIPLKKGGAVYDNLADASFVKYLRRKVRKLEKDFEWEVVTVQDVQALDRYYPVFVRLNQMRSRDKLQLGLFRSAAIEALFRDLLALLLEQGLLRLHILLLNGEPAAGLCNFVYRGKTYFYQSGFDTALGKYSMGHVIHYHGMLAALNEGSGEYDFLSGAEPYKAQWAQEVRELFQLRWVHAPSRVRLLRIVERVHGRLVNSEILKKGYLWVSGRRSKN